MIYLLEILLIILLFISFYFNKKDVLAPSFIFTISFVFSGIWACLYADRWDLGLHVNTFFVILLGVLEFVLVSECTHTIYMKTHNTLGIHQNRRLVKYNIPKWSKIIYLIFVIFIVIYTTHVITKWAGVSFLRIAEASRKYDDLKFDTSFKGGIFPHWLSTSRVLIEAGCYWFGFVFFNNLVTKKKFDLFSVAIVFMSVLCSLLTGSRSGSFYLLIANAYFCFFIIQKEKNNVKFLNYKGLFIVLLLIIIVLLSFRSVGLLMQRSIKKNTMDYLAMYIGAQIKNLDIFLQKPRPVQMVAGYQTFQPLIESFAKRLHISLPDAYIDLPYQTVNGFGLGNVYTIFYSFIYDFGYMGEFILIGFTAFISQYAYEIARNGTNSSFSLLFTMIYGSMFSSLIFAFFSNKFFSNNINIAFLKKIVFWVMFDLLFHWVLSENKIGYRISNCNDKISVIV